MRKALLFIQVFVCLLLLSSVGHAFTFQPKILVSLGDLKENRSMEWRRETCALVHALANQVSSIAVDVTCRHLDTSSFLDSSLPSYQKDHSYHLRILRAANGLISVDVTNWSRAHATDFRTLSWNFKESAKNPEAQRDAMAKAIANFFIYASNDKAFRAGLLVNGAAESNSVEYDQKNGVFLNKQTKQPLSIDTAYTLFENEGERHKNYLRTGVEIGVLLSAAMAIYYKNLVYNEQDFDYGFREGIRKKFNGEAILFDDNDKFSNYGHVYAGVLYYQAARSNGFGSLESFLASFASSATWEFMEYHEVFSLNDQILTPVGGYVIGEASYQISCALIKKGTKIAKIVGYTINPMLGISHAMDKRDGDAYVSQKDCAKERWSDISLYLGIEKNKKPYKITAENTYLFGLNAEVVTIEDYLKPGKKSQLVWDTSLAKAHVEYNGGDGMGDLKVVAQIVSAAYNKKRLEKDAYGQLQGYDILVGVGSATTWRDRGNKEDEKGEDFYGTINVLGATAYASLFHNGYHIRAELGFYGDFTMVKSWSVDEFEGKNPGLFDQNSVIRKRGYSWGLGTTTLAAISVEKGILKVGYEGQMSESSDMKSRHRLGDSAKPADFSDSISSHKVYITIKITKNLRFQLSHEINSREGSAGYVTSKPGTEHRTMGTLVYLF